MSVSWGVVPLIPEAYDWLQRFGYDAKSKVGRYPTFDELWQVLRSFEPMPTEKTQEGDMDLWSLTLGEFGSSYYAHLIGYDDGTNQFNFHFFGSGCREITMVEILQRLAVICGPFVIFDHMSATPLLVDADLEDIATSIQKWQELFAARNPAI